MENQKPKYDLDEILKEVSTENEPLQPEPEKIKIDGIELPAPISFDSVCDNIPKPAPELIGRILRQGHKMMISSRSKAGKSMLVEQLAIAVAHGRSWLTFPCAKGKVLYINTELDERTCLNRFHEVYKASKINPADTNNLHIWNLRGVQIAADELAAVIEQLDEKYLLVIIDPIYKIYQGSENDQEKAAAFCRAIDRIAETGASVVYVHHHSKGAQGSKDAMDRGSGSGVFARDVDALLDLVQLFPGGKEPTTDEDGPTIWKAETTLREFAPMRPFVISYRYPLHRIENPSDFAGWKPRSASSAGGSARADQKIAAKEEAKELCAKEFEAWNEEHGEPPTLKELAEVLGRTEKTVHKYLDDLGLNPRIEKRGRKKAA